MKLIYPARAAHLSHHLWDEQYSQEDKHDCLYRISFPRLPAAHRYIHWQNSLVVHCHVSAVYI